MNYHRLMPIRYDLLVIVLIAIFFIVFPFKYIKKDLVIRVQEKFLQCCTWCKNILQQYNLLLSKTTKHQHFLFYLSLNRCPLHIRNLQTYSDQSWTMATLHNKTFSLLHMLVFPTKSISVDKVFHFICLSNIYPSVNLKKVKLNF